jgi:DNA-directed RNA polymerase subunit K/omega
MSDNEDNYFSDGDENYSDNEKIEPGNKLLSSNKKTIEEIFDSENDEEQNGESDVEDEEETKDVDENYYDEDEQNGGAESEDEEDDDDDEDNDEEDEESITLKSEIKTKKKDKITIDPNLDDYEDDDDDEDDDDENYLQKFDKDISRNYITESHPECNIHNYDEIAKLTIIVKDNDNIIIDPLHRTIPFVTKYEKARVLGQRTKQIECGATPFIKVPENIIEAHIIAELEFQQKRLPFIIKRPIPGGGYEYWNLKDLEMVLF